MKAFEFQATLQPNGTLTVPAEVAAQIRTEGPLRVMLLLAETEENDDWARLTAEQFLKGYDPSDAIDDDLPAR